MLRFSGKLIIASLLALALPSSSRGQTTFPTANGSSVPGAVMMCLDSATGLAAPVLVSGSTCPGSGGGTAGNITQWASTTLGPPSAFGTSPGAVNVPGVNAYVTNATTAIGNNADGVAVSTGGNSPSVSYGAVYNGTTWDRMPGTTAGVTVRSPTAANFLATVTLGAGSALAGKFGIDQTTLGTTNGVTDAPANSSPTNISAATSGTPSTATTLLAASATHHKVILKVEGASVVCFSQFGTAVIGSAGTWCLKGASSANAGDGGSYTTPLGMTEPNAISMISAGTSVLVTGWWQ